MKRFSTFLIGLSLFSFTVTTTLCIRARNWPISSRPIPTPDPLEKVRAFAAWTIEKGLKENGCPKCSVYASGQTLRISHPTLAPRIVAAALLADKNNIKILKQAGFKTLSADQGDQAFNYKIE